MHASSSSVANAEQAIESKIAPPIDAGLAAEIRGHWARRLDNPGANAGRLEELIAAVKVDVRASAAVLGAPAYLAGLSAGQVGMVRSVAVETFAPEEGARLKRARRVQELVARAGRRLTEEMAPRLRQWSGHSNPLAALSALGKDGQ